MGVSNWMVSVFILGLQILTLRQNRKVQSPVQRCLHPGLGDAGDAGHFPSGAIRRGTLPLGRDSLCPYSVFQKGECQLSDVTHERF